MTALGSWFELHAALCWALVGLIWVVQLVLYPSFALVGKDSFPRYHAAHSRRITLVVAPLMLGELATAAVLLWLGFRDPFFLGSLIPLAVIWISTGMVQVPLHDRLSAGFDALAHRRLVSTNVWRTAAWTLRGLALCACDP